LKSEPLEGIKIITHNSSQTEGTWSFDVFHESPSYAFDTTYLFMARQTDVRTCFGYGILLSGESIYFVRQDGNLSTIEALDFVMVSGLVNTWTHVDITRDSVKAEFKVYFNATSDKAKPDFSVVDTEYTVSEQFVVRGFGCDCYIDNVSISDQILITDSTLIPTSTTSTIPVTTPISGGRQMVFDPLLQLLSLVWIVSLVIVTIGFIMFDNE